MTVPATTRRSPVYSGNGVTTVFPFSFKVFLPTDIQVIVTTVGGAIAPAIYITDYAVTLNPDQTISPGGSINYQPGFVPLPTGAKLVIIGALPYSQTLALPGGGNFNPVAIENNFDRTEMQIQQLAAGLEAAISVPIGETVPPLPAAAVRANYVLGFDALGNPIAVVPVSGSVGTLAIDLANSVAPSKGAGQIGFGYGLGYGAGTVGKWLNDLASSSGAGLITYDPTVAYTQGFGKFLNYTFARTVAEIAAAITPTNFAYPPGHVYRYGTNTTPGTTDMTTALQATINQAKHANGVDAIWPADTFLVSTLAVNGSGYNIRTAGGRKTVLKQTTGTSSTTGQILIVTGANINIGDLAFIGNIATDTLEFHHCVYCFDDAAVATIKNVHFGDLYGTNIRGDVLYVGGLAATPTTGIRFGAVSGTNVYRNLLSVVGGEVTGDAVIHDGPVGYRDFDVEPNVGGYQPSDLVLRYCFAGTVQITSDDVALINNRVDIGTLDCDLSRVQATTPGYPSAPGTNAAAILCFYVRLLHIGYFKARNYNGIPFIGGTSAIKSNVLIDVADISNCDLTENVFNSLFADQGTGGIAYLEIGTLLATLSATTKMCFNGNGMAVRVRRGTVVGGLLAASIPGGQYENVSIDMSGATGNALEGCSNSFLQNVTFSNATAATMMRSCSSNTLINASGTFSVVEHSSCLDNRFVHSTLNGVKYANDLGNGFVMTKAMADANQTLSSLESVSTMLTTTGALTAQRNLVVSAAPRIFSVFNNCTGFGIQVIGPTGTGIVIAVGKRAIVQFDGTNVVRVTADI